jgi:hypothetical protein
LRRIFGLKQYSKLDTTLSPVGDEMATSIEQPLSLLPSAALMAFVKRQVSLTEPFSGKERRLAPRHLLLMPVVVQGVASDLSLLGDPQAMVTRDISHQGMGLVYEQPFHHRRIVVRLSYPEEGTILAAEVRWSKPLGPFYQLGCDIIGRLKNFPG